MRVASFLPLALFGAATACFDHVVRQDNSTGGNNSTFKPEFIKGVDNFNIDPATTGYFFNHFAINVKNLTTMMDFYTNVFGMRHLFTLRMTEHYSLTYMAHAAGGMNSSGFQTVDEMIREKNHRPGRIEMQFHDDPRAIAALTSSSEVSNTFSHVGLIVPDIPAALKRFETLGVNILSRPGDSPAPGSAIYKAFGAGFFEAGDPETDALIAVFTGITQEVIFVQDPDGNVIEVHPQNEVPLAV